jgi:hypothetical protein
MSATELRGHNDQKRSRDGMLDPFDVTTDVLAQ